MKKEDLRRFRNSFRKFERNFTNLLKEHCCSPGLSLPQCHVLLEIEISGKTTAADLSKRLGLDPSNLSRIVDGLVDIGLLRRNPHRKDRRVIVLFLTEQGKVTCNNINQINDDYYTKNFSSFPESKCNVVIRDFEILVNTLIKEKNPSTNDEKCCLNDESQLEEKKYPLISIKI
jgi:DNA-binding MarR family transcriptional regulator